MKRHILGVLAIAPALTVSPAMAQEASCTSVSYSQEAEVTQIEETFFDRLKANDMQGAFDLTLGKSPLMTGRTADKVSLVSQFASAVQLYGPIKKFERICEERLGTLLVRRTYLAQHDEMLTRWKLHFMRLPRGWNVGLYTFEDQMANW